MVSGVSRGVVLIVEDNPASRKLARFVLTDAGFEIHTAVSAEEALELLTRISPRVILTDLHLPGMQGHELIRHLAGDPRRNDMVVIAFTASGDRADIELAKLAGCDDFIAKPIEIEQLVATVTLAFRT